MIIEPSLPSGHTIFSDDIREEVGGKITLVGIYAGVMLVSELPATLSQLCACITLREHPETSGNVALRILFEADGQERLLFETEYEVEGEFSLPQTDDFRMREVRILTKLVPFAIPGEGRLKVRAYKDGDEIRLGSMKIQKATTSLPPQATIKQK